MKKYVIITDSCCDLSADLIEKLGIIVLPLSFQIDGKTYKNYSDEREITAKDFYNLMRNKKKSITSQVNPTDFIDIFKEYVKQDYDILSISFSSALSGTYNSSLIAKNYIEEEFPNAKLCCVDSLCASLGQGLLVNYAAINRNNGVSIEDNVKWIEENKLNLAHWFTVDDLGTLARGGRLSAPAAFLGTLIGIKPVLHVSNEGKLVPVNKVRGRKKALLTIINKCVTDIVKPEEQTIFISHGDSIHDAETIGNALIEKLHVKSVYYNNVGPVIGSHSGPGTIAVFYLGAKR